MFSVKIKDLKQNQEELALKNQILTKKTAFFCLVRENEKKAKSDNYFLYTNMSQNRTIDEFKLLVRDQSYLLDETLKCFSKKIEDQNYLEKPKKINFYEIVSDKRKASYTFPIDFDQCIGIKYDKLLKEIKFEDGSFHRCDWLIYVRLEEDIARKFRKSCVLREINKEYGTYYLKDG